ncbi:MAG: transposase [bacterium]|nr:transposase [bacterium]
MKRDYHQPFVENQFYHILNRGNNKEKLFYKRDNYHYFLLKYNDYLSDYLDMYAYCLMPNHFHLLVQVKTIDAIDSIIDVNKKIGEQFRKFFLSYAQAINKQQGRTGSLFQKPFKRILILDHNHLLYLVYYIHSNPQRHGFIDDFKQYPFSSYQRFLDDRKTKLFKKQVLGWFDSTEEFIKFHQEIQSLSDIDYALIDD